MATILYVGTLAPSGNSMSRARNLERLGHTVETLEGFPPEGRLARLAYGARRRLGLGLRHPLNGTLRRAVARSRPDVLWVDKGLNIEAATLRALRRIRPGLIAVHYTPDDSRIATNVSVPLRRALREYDLCVTTKTHNVEYLRELGARRVFMSWKGFDPVLHRPPAPEALDPALRGRVLFMGSWERERAGTMAALLRAGLPVTVISSWKQWAELASVGGDLVWHPEERFGPAYAVSHASAAVSLCFLRKLADDQHTQRSVEVPACGGVMVAERTAEHLALFAEGTEAVYFATDAECVEVCRALVADPERRARIARAGRLRCESSGYSLDERLTAITMAAGIPTPARPARAPDRAEPAA